MRLIVQSVFIFMFSVFVLLSYVSKVEAEEGLISQTSTRDEQIIVFVSFSMPEPALKSWLLDAQRVDALVVIKGLVNNSFKETLQAFAKLTDEDAPVGIQIDPALFQTYAIEQVPAVVITQNGASLSYDVIRGNTTMRYALQTLYEKGEIASAQLKQALVKLGARYE